MAALLRNIVVFMEMIKFSHTIFALPFALSGALLAARGLPSGRQLFFIVLAMVGARTGAMAMNRLIDAAIDARNPRTAGRAIPAGLLSRQVVLAAIVVSTALMFWSAAMLNPLCLKLAPVALFFLVLYSYCKRFTALAHVVLGICLAAAPMGAWAALRGAIELPAVVLGLMVLFWVAGFDILYALQDLEFDRQAGLHSIPVALGVSGSLWLARLFHLVTLALLAWLMALLHLGGWFMAGSLLVAALLLYEHLLLRNGDLTKLDAAFFTMNGYISLTFLAATALEVFL
ncbi:UbiA-like polyprenyltransferase [Trichlorobacter ammonificans]|uniref:4-hydroxybenzoate polyprenyltransferase n=1 Tax=Trichlorobacter ammonificans TaxID=2916410 RepID=A0ABM9DBV4_9BACT|nr:UbiA-like polyprenyltransferase [Trichlorobacter ammonificans]CAH2032677.1 4-hydroxybenzoate polyprenyltransferase [Trichlorobacter ammonificans]